MLSLHELREQEREQKKYSHRKHTVSGRRKVADGNTDDGDKDDGDKDDDDDAKGNVSASRFSAACAVWGFRLFSASTKFRICPAPLVGDGYLGYLGSMPRAQSNCVAR